jgi:hypothetical protein
MALLCRNELETIDDFIDRKVLQLIEQSIVENKKKRKVKEKVHKKYCKDFEEEVYYLDAVSELSKFPKYSGRGVQDYSPDIQGSICNDGFTSMTLWYSDVSPAEVEDFNEQLMSDGFLINKKEFTKETSKLKYYVMIEYSKSNRKMRLYHKITKII